MILLKRSLSGIVALCLILTPVFANAQGSRTPESTQEETLSARAAGIADAKHDTDVALWFSVGCLFSVLGVGAANIILPQPSQERLMGKPISYVRAYTESYRATHHSLQATYAVYGCLTSCAIVTPGCFIYLISTEQSEITCPSW
ncbi:MAG: hypothetical protein JSW02_07480 [candidate division WOR-3 bacterium]|nr:MAG: hypothetical protein JSW02_07480 [candidate division WOR-3 bacterium]